ncbi:hypothetical protein PR048_021737 [Dryococelus australis]|uniref:Uncharacterized protein n=1 Tax=Dryococelus australis TaxID=614101 RepID=A0ABQ9GZ87_9NEOP|nr:hypothetical protein PR048_021737 [Dryococelus australis]
MNTYGARSRVGWIYNEDELRACPLGHSPPTKVNPGLISGGVSPGFSQVGIVPGDAVGWRVFSGISRFPPPFHYGAAPHSLQSPASALKTSLLRAAQISSLTRPFWNRRPRKLVCAYLRETVRHRLEVLFKPATEVAGAFTRRRERKTTEGWFSAGVCGHGINFRNSSSGAMCQAAQCRRGHIVLARGRALCRRRWKAVPAEGRAVTATSDLLQRNRLRHPRPPFLTTFCEVHPSSWGVASRHPRWDVRPRTNKVPQTIRPRSSYCGLGFTLAALPLDAQLVRRFVDFAHPSLDVAHSFNLSELATVVSEGLLSGCTNIFPDPRSNDPSSELGFSLILVPISDLGSSFEALWCNRALVASLARSGRFAALGLSMTGGKDNEPQHLFIVNRRNVILSRSGACRVATGLSRRHAAAACLCESPSVLRLLACPRALIRSHDRDGQGKRCTSNCDWGRAVSPLASHQGGRSGFNPRPDHSRFSQVRILLVGGFSRESPVPISLTFRRFSILTLITLIGSQYPDIKILPNIFTHSLTHSNCDCSFVKWIPRENSSTSGIVWHDSRRKLNPVRIDGRRIYVDNSRRRCRGGVVVRLLAFRLGELGSIPDGVAPGFSHVRIVSDDATAQRVFSGISRSLILALLHSRLASPSLASKT